MVAGESLHSIAYREYGSAELWRGLAAENGIDDPLRVRPGTSIRIPPRERAAELS
jgi:nucleoid-associated protein YgaU